MLNSKTFEMRDAPNEPKIRSKKENCLDLAISSACFLISRDGENPTDMRMLFLAEDEPPDVGVAAKDTRPFGVVKEDNVSADADDVFSEKMAGVASSP